MYNGLYYNTAVANTDTLIYKIKIENLIQQYVSLLWDKLKFPYSQQFRSLLLKILIALEGISYLLNPLQPSSPKYLTYKEPHKTSLPSFESQVTNPAPASLIIDPIQKSLQQNYYYPLTYEMPIDEMEYDNNEESTPVTQPSLKPPSKKIETSIDTISDFLQEMEGDDPPTQSEFTTAEVIAKQQANQVQASFHKHRFSIYRRIYTNAGQSSNSQLHLFKSFSKCLKKIDSQAQLLPLRNDRQVHPLTTTDQINNINEVGLLNFFKPYKRSQRSLSGDFHIGTSLTFDELKIHSELMNWFNLYGYSITLSGCQTSDMVRIGFLSRVRGFTYRDDLSNFVMNTQEWKNSPFSFRLYFDTLSSGAKGKQTYVLMIDVDRPNIELGLRVFHALFDGDLPSSPNRIAYLFFPLFKKSYTEEERKSIIDDNDHHTENINVVALSGLQDLNNLIQLSQGTTISIRHLLLAIPAPGTSTGKLFLQVERQANSDYYLCCFHSTDSAKTTVRLGSLESLLKKYVKPENTSELFKDPSNSLKFSGQHAPMKKGKPQFRIVQVPDETSSYAKHAMSKLISPSPKRLASDFEASNNDSTQNTNMANQNLPKPQETPKQPQPQATGNRKFELLEENLTNQSNRLSRLEDCCSKLADTTQALTVQMSAMNDNVNLKFQEMAVTITNIKLSPNRKSTKVQKNNNSSIDPDL